jgi:ferrochelatase
MPPEPQPYDAFLLVSFGGPEGPDDVIPFLRNVTRGRNVPLERLQDVAHHYELFGGVSPINQQCRDLLAAVQKDFAAHGVTLPVYWGNRNWDPYLGDTVTQMARDGVRRALALATSAYSSYSSCRQYREDIARAREQAGPGAPEIEKIRQFYSHPGFIGPLAAATRRAVDELPAAARDGARLVFTAHSIPASMAASSGPSGGAYPAQLAEAARLVAEQAGGPGGGPRPWELAYQSRSGPPSVPWLEPDVNDVLERLAAEGAPAVVLVPAGFVSDHVEVRYDLDVEAAETARRLGLPMARAATPGTDPAFVSMVTALVKERTEGTGPAVLGTLGVPWPGPCPDGCCLTAERPAGRPAATDRR